ncbi:hypothetical protein OKW33_005505 [Paraburkholderia atlantica]
MEERLKLPVWDQGESDVPVLRGALGSLQGKIVEAKEVGSHSVMFVETTQIRVRADGDSLIYFDRNFHRVPRAWKRQWVIRSAAGHVRLRQRLRCRPGHGSRKPSPLPGPPGTTHLSHYFSSAICTTLTITSAIASSR